MPLPHVRSHEDCGNKVPARNAIPCERSGETGLGENRREAVEGKLEDDEQNEEDGENRWFSLRPVRDEREYQPDGEEGREMKGGVADHPRKVDVTRRTGK